MLLAGDFTLSGDSVSASVLNYRSTTAWNVAITMNCRPGLDEH